jgi:hypothetical protein
MSDSSLREALERICDDYSVVDIEMLQETLAAHPAGSGAPVADPYRVMEVLKLHTIECTGPGEVTCRACRDKSWMSWFAYRKHVADALFAAGVVRSEAEVKAEALREAADAWGDGIEGFPYAWLHERADELEGKR